MYLCKLGHLTPKICYCVSSLQYVTCTCPAAYSGDDCSEDFDACYNAPCYPGVTCKDNIAPDSNATCGPCPGGLIGNGFKCYGK